MIKILITGNTARDGLAASLARGFEKLGHQAAIFDENKNFLDTHTAAGNKAMRRLFWKFASKKVRSALLETVEDQRPDLLLVMKGFYFSDAVIRSVKKNFPGTLLFSFNPDNPFNTWHHGNSNDWIRRSIPYYDVNFTWGRFLLDGLARRGAKKIVYLPFGCDAELHHPVALTGDEERRFGADVAFAGSWDEERDWWLSHILDYRLKIWGNSWHKASRKVRQKWQGTQMIGDDFSKVCLASLININIIRKQNIPAHNMRTFEIPACGGFMLTTRTSEQASIWAEGQEIACFSSPGELRAMIEKYLADGRTRAAMAASANKKTSCHSYVERARQIEHEYMELKLGH